MKLLKIAAAGCPVCDALSEVDVAIANEHGLDFECIDLEVFAATQGSVRDYVVSYYVSPKDGMVDVPIYIIVDGDMAKASSLVKEESELQNLLFAWEQYNRSVSSGSKTNTPS